MIILLCLLWGISGFASVIYWGTKYSDYTLADFFMSFLNSLLLGPVVFLLGWLMLGDAKFPVLFKRRLK